MGTIAQPSDTTARRLDIPDVSDEEVNEEERREIEAMMEAGVHFGHKRSHWNPATTPFVYTIRKELHIIDLRKTERMLQRACAAIEEAIAAGSVVLLVGTHPAAVRLTTETGTALGIPYVAARWVGGTLTNFATISKRTAHLRELERKREAKELEKYTKREQLGFSEEIRKLNEKMGGIKMLMKLPDPLIVLSVKADEIAVREARRVGAPVVGVVDTNADPSGIAYPVPANDDTQSSVAYLLGRFRAAVERGRVRKESATQALPSLPIQSSTTQTV